MKIKIELNLTTEDAMKLYQRVAHNASGTPESWGYGDIRDSIGLALLRSGQLELSSLRLAEFEAARFSLEPIEAGQGKSQKALDRNEALNQTAEQMLSTPEHARLRDELKKASYHFAEGGKWGGQVYNFWSAKYGLGIIIGEGTAAQIEAGRKNAQNQRINTIVMREVEDENISGLFDAIRNQGTWNSRRVAFGLKPMGGGS